MNFNSFFNRLYQASINGDLKWEDYSSTCYVTKFEGIYFILCRYNSELHASKLIGTFRELDNDGYVVDNSKVVWTEESSEWKSFNKLFDAVSNLFVSA